MSIRKKILIVSILISFFLFLKMSSSRDPNYRIKGYALDFFTGLLIPEGNVSAIIKESGEKNSTSIIDGYFELNLPSALDYNQNRFTVGIFINSSNRTGYSQLKIGSGSFAAQTQSCSRKQWYFEGKVIDLKSGKLESGNFTISIKGSNEVNSSDFSNGSWDIYFFPCLIPGEIYTFQFYFVSGDKKGYVFLNQVAK